jgi:toxin-antitoxin system PIN domain toxin
MKLLDANLLLYAVNKDAPLHAKAKAWLETTLSGQETVAFSWNVILAFVRLTTRPGLFRNPLSPERAFDLVAAWLDQPSATVVNPGPRHLAILRDLLTALGTGGNLSSDAHLAALAIEQNAELCSCDGDFARFAGLRWRNPLK